MTRDISEKQFQRELDKRGWRDEGFMGYVKMVDGSKNVSASRWNAGDRRRSQLAYLISVAKEHGISTLPRKTA